MTVDHKFKLAPDVFVILAETSQFWGISKSATIRFKKMPANIKQDQIKFISDYFSLIALQELAAFLKVEKGVPDMKPKKIEGNTPSQPQAQRQGASLHAPSHQPLTAPRPPTRHQASRTTAEALTWRSVHQQSSGSYQQRKKQKLIEGLKLLGVLLKPKFKKHNMSLNKNDYVLKKLFVKR